MEAQGLQGQEHCEGSGLNSDPRRLTRRNLNCQRLRNTPGRTRPCYLLRGVRTVLLFDVWLPPTLPLFQEIEKAGLPARTRPPPHHAPRIFPRSYPPPLRSTQVSSHSRAESPRSMLYTLSAQPFLSPSQLLLNPRTLIPSTPKHWEWEEIKIKIIRGLSLSRGETKLPQADKHTRKFSIPDGLTDTQRSEQPPQSRQGGRDAREGGGENRNCAPS